MSMDRSQYGREPRPAARADSAGPSGEKQPEGDEFSYSYYSRLLKSERSLRLLNEHLMAPLVLLPYEERIRGKLADAGKFSLRDLLYTGLDELRRKGFNSADLDETLRGVFEFIESRGTGSSRPKF